MSTLAAPPFVSRPPGDAEAWVGLFDPSSLPVLPATAIALEAWRTQEDSADAHGLTAAIDGDPLMTLKLLAHVAALRRGRASGHGGDAETVTAALVLLGIGPFFRAFGPQPTTHDWLAAQPGALEGFRAVLRRGERAAAFALAFAAHRMDPDAQVIHEAALLHGVAELLLWLRAPTLAEAVARRQAADPTLRSAQAQREVLNAELADIEQGMLRRWRLPPMLVRITDERHAGDPQVRNVVLAVRLARHSAQGWDNPALPDDMRDIGQLLQLGEAPTRRLLLDIDGAR
jgi:HD-like signal output (HDOD) protein